MDVEHDGWMNTNVIIIKVGKGYKKYFQTLPIINQISKINNCEFN